MKIMSGSSAKRAIAVIAYMSVVFGVGWSLQLLGSRISTRAEPVGSIEVSTKYSTYLLGETVDFSVKNNFNSTVYIGNNCPAEPLEVYRLESGKWQRIHDTSDSKSCSNDVRKIAVEANQTRSASFANWPRLFDKAGKYRIVAYVQYYNLVPYSDIEIIEKPTAPAASAPITSPTSQVTTQPVSASGTEPVQEDEAGASTKTISINAGTVQLEYSSTTINILSVSPNAGSGYSTYEISGQGGRSVEITFKGTRETKLELSVRDGQIVQEVE